MFYYIFQLLWRKYPNPIPDSQPWLQGTCIVAYMPHSCKRLYFTSCYQTVLDIVLFFALFDRHTQVSEGLNDDSLWCEWWVWMMIHCDVNDGDDDDGVEDNSRKCGKVKTDK